MFNILISSEWSRVGIPIIEHMGMWGTVMTVICTLTTRLNKHQNRTLTSFWRCRSTLLLSSSPWSGKLASLGSCKRNSHRHCTGRTSREPSLDSTSSASHRIDLEVPWNNRNRLSTKHMQKTPHKHCWTKSTIFIPFKGQSILTSSTWRVADPGFDSCLHHVDFSRLSHTSDLNIGTPVITLPSAWR